MSSSKKTTPSLRYFQARMLSVFNPLFIGAIGTFSLIGFVVWQYWFNPDLTSSSLETPEPPAPRNPFDPENPVNNNSQSPSSGQTNTNNNQNTVPQSVPNSVANNPSATTNSNNANPLNSIVSQANPGGEIFQTVTSGNNRNRNQQGNNTGGKLYEQLSSLPDLFPQLLPTQTANLAPNPLFGMTGIPTNQANPYQYQLRTNPNSAPLSNVTSPLDEAVNRIMGNTTSTQSNVPPTNTYNSANTYGNNTYGYSTYGNNTYNRQVPQQTTSTPPTYNNPGAYGSYSAYGNYGASNYNNTGAPNRNVDGRSYGGVNPYLRQAPVPGNNPTGNTQSTFPQYGY